MSRPGSSRHLFLLLFLILFSFSILWDQVASREYKVVVVKNLGCKIVQTHWIFLVPSAVLDVDQNLFLRECTIVFRAYALLVDFLVLCLEFLEKVVVYQLFALLFELAVVKVQQTFERHESEQELLLIQTEFLGLVVFLDGDLFGHPCHCVHFYGLQAYLEYFVRLPPRVCILNLFVTQECRRTVSIAFHYDLSVPTKEHCLNAENVTQERRFVCDMLLNGLLKLEHLLLHLLLLVGLHPGVFLPHNI